MADIYGIQGLNTSSGTNVLVAAYGNDLVNVTTGLGYSQNLTSTNDVEFESFLDCLFFQNYVDAPRTFNGTVWSNQHVKMTPIAKFQKMFKNKMYLGYIKINGTGFPSRVWASDLPAYDKTGVNTIQWGFMQGTNGVIRANSTEFRASGAGFKTYNIKVGDTLVIASGANAGQHTVAKIGGDQVLDVLVPFKTAQTSITYWVGSNWFDVDTNNSDTITWLSENSDKLLIFKQETLHRYDGSSLRPVRGPGTNSGRSVIHDQKKDINIYFHGSSRDATGFYLYDGTNSINISRAIQPYIDSILPAYYDDIVAWQEGDTYRAYVSDISSTTSYNSAYNIAKNKSVFSYSIPDNKWTIDSISDVITAAGKYRENNKDVYFMGTSDGEAIESNAGYTFDSQPIHMVYETGPIYPISSSIRSVFTRIEVVSRDAAGVQVAYKLWDNPYDVDNEWHGLGSLNLDFTELLINRSHSGAKGIQLRFAESSTVEPSPTIEKVTIYYYPDRETNPEVMKNYE